MKSPQAHLIKKSKKSHRATRAVQTGFSSPATHYTEPRIDLNDVLIENASSSFYVRAIDDSFSDFNIFKNDVLIIDKALTPTKNQLVIVIQDEAFKIIKIAQGSKTEFQIWGVITYIIKSVL